MAVGRHISARSHVKQQVPHTMCKPHCACSGNSKYTKLQLLISLRLIGVVFKFRKRQMCLLLCLFIMKLVLMGVAKSCHFSLNIANCEVELRQWKFMNSTNGLQQPNMHDCLVCCVTFLRHCTEMQVSFCQV